ncbi:putative nuclear pore protein [Gregarina niphandrodes]|uniref:Nuclear pore protein n=1 Tax=Gregarina niphandrodes TaxID=110365 RepID=A0A023B632_GRENI|nr:putative nuclear pore protein [Gregarina niphandrodes]EZG65155.1 putative nuclear pore protein [Gregarina niphandrodes]|eukprot:XP_011134097.1 putative nuclear pore protein [Gregarina niphandrodes]
MGLDSIFGKPSSTGTSLFGGKPMESSAQPLFGVQPPAAAGGGLFGSQPPAESTGGGLFGSNPAAGTPTVVSSMFGAESSDANNVFVPAVYKIPRKNK